MKLLQLNIWGGRLLANAVELIKSENPDFICLQEVFSADKDVGLLVGTLQEMQKDLGYSDEYFSPVFQFKLMNSMTQFGNCILSRQKIYKKETVFTNLEFINDFNFEDHDYNVRNLQHAEIKAGGSTLNILNHHGHHVPSHKNGDEETLRQMGQIAEYIDTLEGAVILTGDFNLAPTSASIGKINSRLNNLSVRYGLKTTRTKLTHKTEVCDYIFVNDDVKVKGFQALEEPVSDHMALVVDFEL